MAMPIEDGLTLYAKAIEEQAKEKAWQRWLAEYPYMTKENFISFEDFYKALVVPAHISQRTTEEILADVYEIREMLKK